jgi:hypothetical protein
MVALRVGSKCFVRASSTYIAANSQIFSHRHTQTIVATTCRQAYLILRD